MKFELDANTLNFVRGGSFNAERPHELMQVNDRSDAGTLHTEDLGIGFNQRIIYFTGMEATDHDALYNWWLNISVGSKNSFTFTDEKGDVGTIKILTTRWNFVEVSYENWQGSLLVEYVT